MKTTYLRVSSALAVCLLTLGFTRAASTFDCIASHQPVRTEIAAASCTSPCPCPDSRFLA